MGISAKSKIPLSSLSPRQLIELDACSRCGECMKWCPIYAVDRSEDLIPGNRITALKKLLKGQHGLRARLFAGGRFSKAQVDRLLEVLYECTACGQCHFVCPSRIDTAELWEALREAVVEAGLGPLPGQAEYLRVLKKYENPFKEPQENRGLWVQRGLEQGTLYQDLPLIRQSPQPVLFYLGCTASYNPEINLVAQWVANLMHKAGVKFGVLGNQENCCRGKLRRMGDGDFAAKAIENIDLLNSLGINTLVTNCAGCFKTIFQDYPRIKEINFKVYHAIEYLDILIREGKLQPVNPVTVQVTYHDPCHLGRHNGIYDAPRRVLQAVPGVELLEMERIRQNSRCCGMGGGLKMGFPEIQALASAERIKEAERTGAAAIVTPCPTCFLGLQTGAAKAESDISVRHLMELVNISVFGQ